MMQEDELVIKDALNHIDVNTKGGREIQPFTISGMLSNLQNTEYQYSKFEIFVTMVIMFSTISGGFLEGYTSPAIPLLLNESTLFENTTELSIDAVSYSPPIKLKTVPPTNLLSNDSTSTEKALSTVTSTNLRESNYTQGSTAPKGIINLTTEEVMGTTISSNEQLQVTTNKNGISDADVSTVIHSIIATSTIPSTILKNVTSNKSLQKRSVSLITNTADNLTKIENDSVFPSNEKKRLRISEEEASWLGSLLLLGACLGAAFSSWIVSLGRRHAILFSAFPRLFGWVLIAMSVSVSTLYAGRFLSGFSLGLVSTAAPIYISEISHPSVRGSFNCIVQLGVNIGIFLAALFGTFMGWHALAVLGGVFVLLYFVPSFTIPNSPSWLVSRGREQEAREVLKKLRGKSFSVEEELQQIITLTEKNKKQDSVGWLDLLRERRSRMPLLVVALVTLVNRFSGYNAIITYCATFLHDAVPFISQYAAATAVCFVQIIATGFSITVVDKWGRRKLLLLSVILMGLSLVIIAICEGIFSTNQGGGWLTVLATMSYVGFYSVGVGPLTWVLLGEMFPMDTRDKASALVSILNWMSAFLITKTYFNMEAAMGVGGTCLVYAGVCLVGAICFYFLVPETKGRTLAEIEAHFSYSQVSWKNLAPKVDRAMSGILDQDLTATIDTYSTFQ